MCIVHSKWDEIVSISKRSCLRTKLCVISSIVFLPSVCGWPCVTKGFFSSRSHLIENVEQREKTLRQLARTGHVTQPAHTLTLRCVDLRAYEDAHGSCKSRVSQSIIHNPWHISSCIRAREVRYWCIVLWYRASRGSSGDGLSTGVRSVRGKDELLAHRWADSTMLLISITTTAHTMAPVILSVPRLHWWRSRMQRQTRTDD